MYFTFLDLGGALLYTVTVKRFTHLHIIVYVIAVLDVVASRTADKTSYMYFKNKAAKIVAKKFTKKSSKKGDKSSMTILLSKLNSVEVSDSCKFQKYFNTEIP